MVVKTLLETGKTVVKKPWKKFEKAADEWMEKTQELQESKIKSERIKGSLRVIAPVAPAVPIGFVTGVKGAIEERRAKELKTRGGYQWHDYPWLNPNDEKIDTEKASNFSILP